jgi:hypothetical protein
MGAAFRLARDLCAIRVGGAGGVGLEIHGGRTSGGEVGGAADSALMVLEGVVVLMVELVVIAIESVTKNPRKKAVVLSGGWGRGTRTTRDQ